jgi:hypothetical protein
MAGMMDNSSSGGYPTAEKIASSIADQESGRRGGAERRCHRRGREGRALSISSSCRPRARGYAMSAARAKTRTVESERLHFLDLLQHESHGFAGTDNFIKHRRPISRDDGTSLSFILVPSIEPRSDISQRVSIKCSIKTFRNVSDMRSREYIVHRPKRMLCW